MAMPSVALALSGGSARGMAHLGALRSLERTGNPLTGLSGSSYGAIIAALYALHGDVNSVTELIAGKGILQLFQNMFDFGFHRGAIVSGRRFREWLDRDFFFGATFADTKYEVAIATTDLARNELAVIRSGSLAKAVQASCALPGFFAPVQAEGRVLIDGGFVEPIPFRALAETQADIKIGLQAGLSVHDSAVVRGIRRYNTSWLGKRFHNHAKNITVNGPLSEVYAGISIFLRSYETAITVPPDAHLITIDPGISWTNFRALTTAMNAGDEQFTQAFRRVLEEQN